MIEKQETATEKDPFHGLPSNIGALLKNAGERFGEATTLHFLDHEPLPFSRVAALAAGARDFLRSLGVQPGDRVLVALDNRVEFQILWLGSASLGSIFVPMNPEYRPVDAAHVIKDSDPRAVVWLDDTHKRLSPLLSPDCSVATVGEACGTFPVYRLSEGDWSALDDGVTSSAQAVIGYTSGSTGRPKGCVTTQAHWVLLAKTLALGLDMSSDDRLLTAQPCYYGDPQYNLVAALWSGASLTVLPKFRSSVFWDQVRASRATKFWCIGAMPSMLMNTPPLTTDRDHSLVAAWCVGIPRSLHAGLEARFGVRWLEAFGTSETAVNLYQGLSSSEAAGEGWLGTLAPFNEIRLVDENGNEMTGDVAEGLLEIRTPLLALGYWNGETQSVQEFERDSWFQTGDVLERRANKYRFVRRQKDIVRRAGENISCLEVEDALRQHPGILNAAVIARPDEIRGEEIWAFLLLAKDAQDLDPQDVIEAMETMLARHKVPRYLTYINVLPMTPSERIAKHHLPELATKGSTYDRARSEWI